jgi:hypothetical protein
LRGRHFFGLGLFFNERGTRLVWGEEKICLGSMRGGERLYLV